MCQRYDEERFAARQKRFSTQQKRFFLHQKCLSTGVLVVLLEKSISLLTLASHIRGWHQGLGKLSRPGALKVVSMLIAGSTMSRLIVGRLRTAKHGRELPRGVPLRGRARG
jgi:hypothetical protein